jgi:uncharacterized integral membrane protein (TIGR00698 family)
MNTASVIRVGQQSLLVILLTVSAAFITAYFVGRFLKVNKTLTTLIGVGTAICGGSAIAAASSAIDADDQDISYSISTIFLFNVIAVFLFPLIGHVLHLSDTGFGMWAGTAINDTSSVVAAGFSYSNAAGNFATVVKLTRSLMIVPVTLALAFITARQNREQQHFNFAKIFPWFVLGFLAAAVLNSTGWIPVTITSTLAQTGKHKHSRLCQSRSSSSNSRSIYMVCSHGLFPDSSIIHSHLVIKHQKFQKPIPAGIIKF